MHFMSYTSGARYWADWQVNGRQSRTADLELQKADWDSADPYGRAVGKWAIDRRSWTSACTRVELPEDFEGATGSGGTRQRLLTTAKPWSTHAQRDANAVSSRHYASGPRVWQTLAEDGCVCVYGVFDIGDLGHLRRPSSDCEEAFSVNQSP